MESKKRGLPDELWFRFQKVTGVEVSSDIDPFVVALLLLAMNKNESIRVRGTLSKKLFAGLNEYQRVYHSWFPDRFHRVDIVPMGLRDDGEACEKFASCAFSGGVDSFYSFLTLLGRGKDSNIQNRLSHTLFMGGFDMPLHLIESIKELTDSYEEMMKGLGIHFVIGSTNVRKFVNTVDWTNAHGQALVASALFFKEHWERFYIPSSYTLHAYPKWGTHPDLDALLSTESMQIIHHGANANRVNKLEVVSKAPETFHRLRVCWIQDIGLRNCGHCEKCMRTMIALNILGVFSKFKTFSGEHPSSKKIRNLKMRTYQARLFAKELMAEALRRRKLKIFVDLGISLIRRELFFRKIVR
jgi:hypothetical protein